METTTEPRYKWGYRGLKKSKYLVGEHGGKVYYVTFSNLEAETDGYVKRPSLHTGWNEFEVVIETNTPTKTLRAACSRFFTEQELRDYVGAINRRIQ